MPGILLLVIQSADIATCLEKDEQERNGIKSKSLVCQMQWATGLESGGPRINKDQLAYPSHQRCQNKYHNLHNEKEYKV